MVTSRPTFKDLIDRLTRETVDWVQHDDADSLHARDGMLIQLRAAVFGGLETGGSSSSFGSRPTIDAAAYDLLDEITVQASEALASVDHHPTPFGHAEHYVRLWSGQTDEKQKVRVSIRRERNLTAAEEKMRPIPPRVETKLVDTTAYDLAQSWLTSIDEYLNPVSLREIAGECPACGATEVHRERDGQFVRAPALSFTKARESGETTGARCASCGATWSPDKFDWLARVVGAAMTLADLFVEYRDGDEHGWDEEFAILRRRHKAKLAKLKQSIEEHGIERPILLGHDGRVWDGHHRLCVAQEIGLTTVPVKIVPKPPQHADAAPILVDGLTS